VLEVHLFDFSGRILREHLSVEFVAKLREERKFPSLDEMVVQMHEDAREARAALATSQEPWPAPPHPTLSPRGRGGEADVTTRDYKDTIQLPQTDFPMKADLARREPEMLAWVGPRGHIRQAPRRRQRPAQVRAARRSAVRERRDSPRSRRQQGAEDIVVKSRTMDGYDAPYVPGWDCHGLPIEHQVEKKYGRVGSKLDPRPSGRPAASLLRSRSTRSARTSAGSA